MTEAQATDILFKIFTLDVVIPEWGNWVSIDNDGEVCVFEYYPVLQDTTHTGLMWDETRVKGTLTRYKVLFYYEDPVPSHTETQIINVKDLLS